MKDQTLSAEDKTRVMGFLCSFAWADLEVQQKERAFVRTVANKIGLDDAQREQVEEWLRVPPPPEVVDPARIPASQRALVLELARAMIVADGSITDDESESFSVLEALLK